jgi:hypothetical protein
VVREVVASMGVVPTETKETSPTTTQASVMPLDAHAVSSPSRLAAWWSFERPLDHVTSYAALALGLAALVVAIVAL